MAKLNRIPWGLLGFLGIKNGGRYPEELSAVLLPTWDLLELYTVANRTVTTPRNATVNAVGYQAYETVPNGQIWYATQMSANAATLTAGQALQFCLASTDAAATSTVALDNPNGGYVAGERPTATLTRSVWFAPGDTIGIIVSRITAGPISVSFNARIAVFET